MTYPEMIMWLLFAHFLGDWGIWNPWMAETKGKHWQVMVAHCVIYTGCCVAAMAYIGWTGLVGAAIKIFISHYISDKWKCKYATADNFPTWHSHVDQALHIGVLLGVMIKECNLV